MRLLEKDPDRRPAIAGDVVEALRALEVKPTFKVEPSPAGARAGRNWKLIVLAAGLLAAAPLAWWLKGGVLRVQTANGTLAEGADGGDSAAPRFLARCSDPDRKAAEWVLSVGGVVQVNGGQWDTKGAGEWPQDPFRLTGVHC
jgi:hypothetical protein